MIKRLFFSLPLLIFAVFTTVSCEKRETEINLDNIEFEDSTNILMGGKWVYRDYTNYDGMPATWTLTLIFYTDSNVLYNRTYINHHDDNSFTEEWKYTFDGEDGQLIGIGMNGEYYRVGTPIKYDKESQVLLWAENGFWSMQPIYDFHREEL